MMATGAGAGGIGLALLAAAAFEVSYVLQAVEARRVRRAPSARLGLLLALVRRPVWGGAIALSVAGFGLQVLALRLVPLTVVQPVLTLGLVLLLVLSVRVLGETVGPREAAAAFGVIVGVTVLVLAMPERGPIASWVRPAVACAALGGLCLAPFALRSAGARWLVCSATAGDALAALAINEVARTTSHPGPATAAWAAAAAVAGVLALTAEASALQRSPASSVAPVVLAGQVAIPVALAPIVAGDRWGATPLHGGVIALGLALVIGATASLARSPAVGRVRQAA